MDRKALVIGINDYPNLGSLSFATSDAERVGTALRDFGRFRLVDPPRPDRRHGVTMSALNVAINRFINGLRDDDLGLLYFAGHGAQGSGRAYLLPSEARLNEPEGGIDLRDICRKPTRGRLIVVVDCCHAEPSEPLQGPPEEDVSARVIVLGASRAHEQVVDEGGGLLTRTLCEIMAGAPTPIVEAMVKIAGRANATPGQESEAWVAGTQRFPIRQDELLNPGGSGELDDGGADVLDEDAMLALYLESVKGETTLLASWFGKAVAHATELGRVYVDIAVEEDDEFAEHRYGHPGPRSLPELVADGGAWMLFGHPGAGKTTLLRHFAHTLASNPNRPWIPVYVPLKALAGAPKDEDWLKALVEDPRATVEPRLRGLAQLLERRARHGGVVFLLDALDEVPTQEAREQLALTTLPQLVARFEGQARIVLTSRWVGVAPVGGDFRNAHLLPLEPDAQAALLGKWLVGRPGAIDRAVQLIKRDDTLSKLAGNPLHLSMLAVHFLGTPPDDEPAINLSTFFKETLDKLLHHSHKRPEPSPITDIGAARTALRELAWQLTDERRDTATLTELQRWLGRRGRVWPEVEDYGGHGPLLRDLSQDGIGLLVRPEDPTDGWAFCHRSFREALTAEVLAEAYRDVSRREEFLGTVKTHAERDPGFWAEPYALMTGLVDEPDAAVRTLLKVSPDLGLRAMVTAPKLSSETLLEAVGVAEDLEERRAAILSIPDKLDDSERLVVLVPRLHKALKGQRTLLEANDLWVLTELCEAIAGPAPDRRHPAMQALRQLYEARPPATDALVPWSQVIPAGQFWQGSPDGIGGSRERPRHQVTLTRSFQLGATSVTNRQWQAFDPEHGPHKWKGVPNDELADHPVVGVSWYAAQAFCRWLSLSWGQAVRLPTEAEWERACRGPNGEDEANHDRWWFGDSEAQLAEHAWYDKNSDDRTHTVGTTPAGAGPWGLHDMHGNVWEWCSDWYSSDSYARAEAGGDNVDPKGPSGGGGRVIRGGCYWNDADWCRSAFRYLWLPAVRDRDLGFRVLLPAAPGR